MDSKNIVNGVDVSNQIKDEIATEIKNLGISPALAVIMVGDDEASAVYVKNKQKACEYVNIKSVSHMLSRNTSTEELVYLIKELNNDDSINGILVQLPLPNHIEEKRVLLSIAPSKDVDGFHPYNMGLISSNNPIFKPCTPFGCMELLKKYYISVSGKNCLVIGRSNMVGKPLAMLLLNEDATVTIAHSKTKNLHEYTKNADIIFVAVGTPKLLKPYMVSSGVVIVDIGINRLEDGSLCGDVDLDCLQKAKYMTPVPKGVGPMTIAMLMKNCLLAYKIQNREIKR